MIASKELQALERLRNTLLAEGYWQDVLQDVATIEKSLQALEIIKGKCIDMYQLRDLIEFNIPSKDAVEIYNELKDVVYQITIEEFDLLKEVLDCYE